MIEIFQKFPDNTILSFYNVYDMNLLLRIQYYFNFLLKALINFVKILIYKIT